MNRLGVMYVRCLTAAFLAHLEYTPHILDKERVEQEYKRVSSRRDEIEARMKEITGGINLNSNDQLAEFLYDKLGFSPPSIRGKPIKTPKGKFKTDEATLNLLKATNKKQTEFLALFREYNDCSSMLSKCLDFFLRICEEKDGKMYFQFNQGRVVSHRLSSTGVPVIAGRGAPQGQNINRDYKKMFTVPSFNDGFKWKVAEADGSQLEFRVGVQLSHDKQGMEDIRNGVDVHANTAATFTAAGEPKTRQEAKASTFRPMFGGQGQTRAEKAYKEFFSSRYSGLAAMQKGWCYEALRAQDHGVRMPWGIVYYFPNVKMESSGYIRETTRIYNLGIQGFATADIIPIVCVLYWNAIRDLPIIPFTTVHDSIGSYVREDAVELWKEICRDCFTTGVHAFLKRVYDYDFQTPLGCGLKVATHWGDTKSETSYDYYPDTNSFTVKEK